ncbi:hypothetical protein AAG570_011765, partial [Ranatra chinensis]
YGVFPVRDPDGYQIIFHRLQEFDPRKFVLAKCVKLLCVAAEACTFIEGTIPGYIFLFDTKGIRLGHLMRLPFSQLKKLFIYTQDGIPVRLKAIHILNAIPLIDKLMFILRPFMKKKLLKMIHFHSGDYGEIHRYIPKSCLPCDFGGDLTSCESLHGNKLFYLKLLLHLTCQD